MPTIRKCAGSSGTCSAGGSEVTTGSWEASITYSPNMITHSGSNCMQVPCGGLKTWTGSFMCYSQSKPCSAGEEIGFSGNSNTVSLTGAAIVTSVSVSFDFNNCAPVSWNVSVQGNGEASIGGGTTDGNGNSDSVVPEIPTASGGGCSLSADTATFDYTETCEVSGGFATASSNCWAMHCIGAKSGTFSAQTQGYPPSVQVGEVVGVSGGTEDCSVGGSYVITGVSTSVDNSSSEPISCTVTGTLAPQ